MPIVFQLFLTHSLRFRPHSKALAKLQWIFCVPKHDNVPSRSTPMAVQEMNDAYDCTDHSTKWRRTRACGVGLYLPLKVTFFVEVSNKQVVLTLECICRSTDDTHLRRNLREAGLELMPMDSEFHALNAHAINTKLFCSNAGVPG